MQPAIAFALLIVAGTNAVAQRAPDDSVPIADRVIAQGILSADQTRVPVQPPILSREWSLTGGYKQFVGDHWQLGIFPTVDGFYDNRNGNHAGVGTELFAAWGIAAPFGTRAYLGGTVDHTTQSNSLPFYRAQWRAGLMGFLTPTLGLRLEYLARTVASRPDGSSPAVRLVLDSYYDRRAGPMDHLPCFGTIEVNATAFDETDAGGEQSVAGSLAMFLSPWLQIGGDGNYSIIRVFDPWIHVHSQEGFVRLYAPLSPALMPFVGGTLQGGDYGDDVAGISTYIGSIGARHWIQKGLALDGAVTLTAHHRFSDGTRPPNTLGFLANLVMPLELRRR